MEITINKKQVNIDNFTISPNRWIWSDDLTDGDKIKLLKLYWRYDFFRSVAYKSALEKNRSKIKATNYMYETQEAYAELLGIPRSKIPALFKKLEELKYIVRVKSGTQKIKDGVFENVPRDYIVVLNPCHKDYENDLNDVWIALSQRLNTLENKNKQNQITYKQMVSSYYRLFGDRLRWCKTNNNTDKDEVNFGFVDDCNMGGSPKYDLPPLDVYDDIDNNLFEEDNELNQEYQDIHSLFDPPF